MGTAADDSVLALLAPMQNLGELDLRRTKVTGAGLVHLSKLVNLWFLELEGLPIGDEHVKHLARLTNLSQLGLSGRRHHRKVPRHALSTDIPGGPGFGKDRDHGRRPAKDCHVAQSPSRVP